MAIYRIKRFATVPTNMAASISKTAERSLKPVLKVVNSNDLDHIVNQSGVFRPTIPNAPVSMNIRGLALTNPKVVINNLKDTTLPKETKDVIKKIESTATTELQLLSGTTGISLV